FIDLVFLRGANAMSMANGFVYPHAIDGSLWTLPLEFLCYIILGVIFCFSKTIRPVLLVFSFMLVLSIYLLSNPTGIGFYSISIQAFVPLATSFFMGVLMSLTKPRWDFWKIKSFLFFSLFL
ncbi:acyltransferase, partial [Klebsiella pneumoniae]|nr:acyltransferase [Klebsiella pneumoniae]